MLYYRGIGCSKCGMGDDTYSGLNNWMTWLGAGLLLLVLLPHLKGVKG